MTLTTPDTQERRFSKVLHDLVEFCEREQVTFGQLLRRLSSRGYPAFTLLVSLPFLTPVQLPGLSIPLGIAIAITGMRMALGKRPWLPEALHRLKLPPKLFAAVFRATEKMASVIEKLIRPRGGFFHRNRKMKRVNALTISFVGFLLALPLPPTTNLPPALTVFFLSLGMVEKDDACILVGYLALLLTIVWFTLLAVLGWEGVRLLLGLP